MSKYGGTISIIDWEGNIVFERELTPDEMIEELLKRPAPAVLDESTIGPVIEKLKKVSAKQDPQVLIIPVEKKPARRCGTCGKPGHTYKACPDRGEASVKKPSVPKPVEPAMPKKDTEALTEDEYQYVRDAKKDEIGSLDAANELDLPLSEVNKAYGSASYEHYLMNR